jgi:hypothetical protein
MTLTLFLVAIEPRFRVVRVLETGHHRRMSLSPIDALPLFFAMLVLTELGRKLHARSPHQKSSSAIEGAIFGLFGLLLAFTFSGAVARYDTHRKLVIEEVNDISTTYLRLDLLPKELQPGLRQNFRD